MLSFRPHLGTVLEALPIQDFLDGNQDEGLLGLPY